MAPENSAEKLLLCCRETARRLSISPRTLWSLTKSGDIAHVKVGRRVLYRPADLIAWIDRNRSGGIERLIREAEQGGFP